MAGKKYKEAMQTLKGISKFAKSVGVTRKKGKGKVKTGRAYDVTGGALGQIASRERQLKKAKKRSKM